MSAGQKTRTIEEIREEATELYKRWGQGQLFHTIKAIDELEDAEEWRDFEINKAHSIEVTIREKQTQVIKHLEKFRREGAREIKTMRLQFPSGSSEHDRREWCLYAKKALYMVERFYSHVMHKNPHPRHFEGWEQERYNQDPRGRRSEIEQEWLQTEDRLVRIEKRRHKRALKKAKRAAEGGPRTHHKKGRAHAEPRDMPPPGPHAHKGHETPEGPHHGMVRGEKRIPAFPERRIAKPAIVPYERSSSRAPPRVAARLPAFPKFPAYPRK